jgi:hypothetical protein
MVISYTYFYFFQNKGSMLNLDNNIKINFKEMKWDYMERIHFPRERIQWQAIVKLRIL